MIEADQVLTCKPQFLYNTNALPSENMHFLMRFCLSVTLKRSKKAKENGDFFEFEYADVRFNRFSLGNKRTLKKISVFKRKCVSVERTKRLCG